MLPADAGCVVDNVDTVIAVYEAVILGKPVMDRIVTVTGQGIKNPQNFDVLSGTDMAELIEAAGGLTDNVSKVISGGPMMGFAMYDTHVPCIKTSSACLCLEKDDVADAEQTACINCGRCVEFVPAMSFLQDLQPLQSMVTWRASRNLMVWSAANVAAAVISALPSVR